jgi:NDP-sugar pyrophosphorylase family protein
MILPVAILAGGLATRLRPLTRKIPKSLVEIQGEPFIRHQLRLLASRGIGRAVILAGYLGEMIQEALGGGEQFGMQVEYSFDGPRLLGTAGAVRKALPLLGKSFFLLYGDSYLPCDYSQVQRVFEEKGRLALMTVFRNEDRWDRGNIELKDGEIQVYDKKVQTPGMRHIDYGLGVFQARAFERVPADDPYDLAVLYQELLALGELSAFEVRERFYEIGSLEGMEDLRRHLAERAGKIKI